MANLIEQMNALKGLRDEDLAVELQQPTGRAAPFLVATEISRRKDMRQRYEGEQARRKPQTTVMEDLVTQAMVPSAPGRQMGQPPGGGINMAVQGFKVGGPIDLEAIGARYNEQLEGLGDDRDRARAMALLAASAGILGRGSSNFGRNLGAGVASGLDAYSSGLKAVDSREADLLRGMADVGQAQQQFELSQLDRSLREAQTARTLQEIEQNTPEYWRTKGAEQGLEGADLERYALSKGAVGKSHYAAAPVFGVDEKGDEVSARFNTTTGEYVPNPRADGSTPQAFIPYSAAELVERRENAKIASKRLAQLPADTAGVTDSLRTATTAMDTIKRAYTDLNFFNTGMLGAISEAIPGGGWAKDTRSLVRTLQSGLAATALQAMRDASKTGGALGNVSDKDLELLQTKIVNLDPNQSEAQLKEQLEIIYNELNSALQTRADVFNSTYAATPGAVPQELSTPRTFEEFMSAPVENDPMDAMVDKYRTK